ncbi:DNA mismatch repair endonuclease MutL [Symbiobacterium thermophilum]|uniref:DNA mismatch repair protein MutL n=2 Tax=Symbiobacterium thermophilum TaxID=2734 RepID=MUTL_SYMTH|nr:DNA mismatch repair endonuclease MutL [Symbiobacterium thermophilum]Q67NL0.1 RecName: Full=DNA mismatch repair protein MutL [Symbiobacterium thermophilum IAM 14863]BAD40733.1 DNA mismatch repair protein [Symbiobacterium thermophilum IAM 14863]
MARIRLLDERTANQIAAGEVVERPASVVKELVENALDAQAKRIVVEVSGGGRELVRVTDDGIGMVPEDARLALQRHATSKIRTAEDLNAITTLGFRGEALPSIAAVSQFELITRPHDQLAGYRILAEGGQIVAEGEHGCPAGTRVTVRDLFFNVPARLKYLKTNATELAQIGDILTRLALANPEVAFRFQSGQAQVFATPGTGDLTAAVAALLGREMAKELLPVDYRNDAARVHGFVGRPTIARAGRSHQYFFVNRRAVRTIAARYALEEAYAHLLPNGRYPVCILFIEVEPHEVDVNVHPTKAEVRFQRDREVRAAVYQAARHALGAALLIPGTEVTADGEVRVPDRAEEKAALQRGWVPPGAGRPGEGGGRAAPPPWRVSAGGPGGQTTAREPVQAYLPAGGLQAALAQRAAEEAAAAVPAVDLAEATLVPRSAEPGELIRALRPLGQVHRSYIACDGPEGLYLIDQHAAHERIFFERLYAAAQEQATAVQRLLFPLTLDLTPAQMAIWQENAAIFAESGFEAEPFGGNTLLIHGVPAGLGTDHVARLVCDFLDRLQEDQVAPGTPVTDRRRRVLAAMAACKAAIKARDPLQPEDIAALLSDLAACASPETCPHGRPTVICVSISELEKRFKR